MAKTLIEIKADTKQYQQAMSQAAAEMKKLTAEHSLAAAQAKLNGSAQDVLRSKVTELTSKMEVQKGIVQKNGDQYDNLKQKLEAQKTTHDQLKTKVDAAKKAYEDSAKATGEDSEETQKLKAEYEKLSSQLTNTENSMKKTETSIENQEAAVTKSKAALENMEAELRDVNAELAKAPFDEYARKAEKVGGTLTSAGQKLAPLSAAVAAVGVAAIKTTADFDSEMSKVSAISGATGTDLQALRDKAREMGSKTKFSASEAAQGMEYMAMAGWKTEDMLDGLEGIMNLAAASGEDLGTTSDIVTDALTAFGLTAKDSGHFADILAAASSNANTNVSMMGETFKYAAPIAGALGYSAEDTAEAIGLMANAGIKSSQAGTSLRSIMSNLTGDIEISGKAIGDVTVATTNADGTMRGFSDILADCRKAFSGLTAEEKTSTAESLVGKNAMSGFLALMNAGEGDINKLSGAIANCDGSAANMANTMQDNLQGQITILLSQLQELAISFGEIMMPTIREIVSKVQDFVDKLNGLDEGQKKNIIRIGLFVIALAPLLIGLGNAITFTANVSRSIGFLAEHFVKAGGSAGIATKATGLFTKALAFITGPAGIVVAAIAAVTAVIITLWNTNEDFRNAITAIWERIKTAFETFTLGISERLSGMGISFESVTSAIKAIWEGFCNLLAPVIEAAFSIIATVIETAFNYILGIWDLWSAVFSGDWSGAWEAVKGIFSSVWEGIKGILSAVITAIVGVVNVFLGWFGTSWKELWNGVRTFFEGIWNGISTFFTTIWTTITTTVTTFCNTVHNTISTIFAAVANVVTTIWDTIKNAIQVAIMFIVEVISAAFQLITVPFRFIWENCRDTIMEVWETIKGAVQTALDFINNNIITPVMNAIQTTITTVWNAISTTVSTVVNAIKTAIQTAWNAIRDNVIKPVMEAIKTTITTVWNAIKTAVKTTVNAVKTTVSTVFNAVKTTVTTIWNNVKSATTTAWNAVKTAVTTPINAAKSAVTTAINSIKSTISSVWNAVKSATSSTWNAIKSAITSPIEAARNAVGNAISAIRSKFNFSWSLPHLKLPHPQISGHFSLNPPSVPHFSIAWYKSGGIMTDPTVFGAAGNTLLAGGEAGAEAILPLKQFYDRLGDMLDKKLNAIETGTTVYVYVTMDGEVVATKVYSRVEEKFVDEIKRKR